MTNTILTVIFIATVNNYNTLSIKKKKGQKFIPDDKDSKGLTSKKCVLKGSFSSLNSLLSKRMDFEEETGRSQYYMTVNIVSMTKPLS